MTVFGGLYSVRGYKEDEIVADGGTLISAQYEFDLTQYSQPKESNDDLKKTNQIPWFSKLALVAFNDFARAKTKHPVEGEKGIQQLCSIGTGVIAAIGDNFDAAIYYGHPLISTADTDKGNGRWSFSFTLRW
jgi:hemolysin activation/secretion protein